MRDVARGFQEEVATGEDFVCGARLVPQKQLHTALKTLPFRNGKHLGTKVWAWD
jgi:hypothetical protein